MSVVIQVCYATFFTLGDFHTLVSIVSVKAKLGLNSFDRPQNRHQLRTSQRQIAIAQCRISRACIHQPSSAIGMLSSPISTSKPSETLFL